jgi:hypothetical protein
VRLEASTKSHVHNLIHEFLINMAFIRACPNFKKGLKMVSGPLGVNDWCMVMSLGLTQNCNGYFFLEFQKKFVPFK